MKAERRNDRHAPNSIAARLPEEQGLRLAATSRARKAFPVERRSTADELLVDQLAAAMKARLATWRHHEDLGSPLKFSAERLAIMLAEATCSGDPISVAVVAMSLHARGADHQVVAEHARRALLRGSREALVVDAERYRKLRNVPDNQLGAAGVPCVALPSGQRMGEHLNGIDADTAVDAYTPESL